MEPSTTARRLVPGNLWELPGALDETELREITQAAIFAVSSMSAPVSRRIRNPGGSPERF